uniref:Uncharacterized protein n=1 Tax=Ixodes ricinus TaxID=34613 RepID=A0A6B0V676_IXORI
MPGEREDSADPNISPAIRARQLVAARVRRETKGFSGQQNTTVPDRGLAPRDPAPVQALSQSEVHENLCEFLGCYCDGAGGVDPGRAPPEKPPRATQGTVGDGLRPIGTAAAEMTDRTAAAETTDQIGRDGETTASAPAVAAVGDNGESLPAGSPTSGGKDGARARPRASSCPGDGRGREIAPRSLTAPAEPAPAAGPGSSPLDPRFHSANIFEDLRDDDCGDDLHPPFRTAAGAASHAGTRVGRPPRPSCSGPENERPWDFSSTRQSLGGQP